MDSGSVIPTFSYRNEISNSFRIFDVERNGTISANDLKLILRALGFRVTKHDVIRDVFESYKRRGLQERKKLSTKSQTSAATTSSYGIDQIENEMIKEIDLETVLDIILDPGSKYNRNNRSAVEMEKIQRTNFRLFDVEKKGFITVADLKRAIRDFKECKEDILGREYTAVFEDMNDDELKAMIEEFDGDQDGMISEEEFRKIMTHKI